MSAIQVLGNLQIAIHANQDAIEAVIDAEQKYDIEDEQVERAFKIIRRSQQRVARQLRWIEQLIEAPFK